MERLILINTATSLLLKIYKSYASQQLAEGEAYSTLINTATSL
jgi:hypothetical protein